MSDGHNSKGRQEMATVKLFTVRGAKSFCTRRGATMETSTWSDEFGREITIRSVTRNGKQVGMWGTIIPSTIHRTGVVKDHWIEFWGN